MMGSLSRMLFFCCIPHLAKPSQAELSTKSRGQVSETKKTCGMYVPAETHFAALRSCRHVGSAQHVSFLRYHGFLAYVSFDKLVSQRTMLVIGAVIRLCG